MDNPFDDLPEISNLDAILSALDESGFIVNNHFIELVNYDKYVLHVYVYSPSDEMWNSDIMDYILFNTYVDNSLMEIEFHRDEFTSY